MNELPAITPPPIPKHYGRNERVKFWGKDRIRQNTLATSHLGDGRVMLWVTTMCNRPSGWIIRVGSEWVLDPEHEMNDAIEAEVLGALEDEFSSFEREWEFHCGELGMDEEEVWKAGHYKHPVVKSDVGWSWCVLRVYDGKRWVDWPEYDRDAHEKIRNKLRSCLATERNL